MNDGIPDKLTADEVVAFLDILGFSSPYPGTRKRMFSTGPWYYKVLISHKDVTLLEVWDEGSGVWMRRKTRYGHNFAGFLRGIITRINTRALLNVTDMDLQPKDGWVSCKTPAYDETTKWHGTSTRRFTGSENP